MESSNRAIQTCLTDEELFRYQARDLTDREMLTFQEHVEQCSSCASRAERLRQEHDSWVQQLRQIGKPPDTRPLGDQPGLTSEDLGGYAILEEVSRGGQGIVYRATQESTKREVAVKVLREGLHASPAARRRFEREIELVAGLRHPNIVTVFDSGRTRDGRKYLVMDFVRGLSLGRYIRSSLPTLRQQLALFAKICSAVNAAHQRGVIHRDLKPSNILVSEAGEPYVLDFGLARQVTETSGKFVTTTGQVAGTLPYMSPEQALGTAEGVDIRSDVYSLGVILYELLTGSYPYPVEGDTLEVLKHIAETPPAPPTRVLEQHASEQGGAKLRIDADLQTIVLKALSKESDRRYQTAGDLARDIEHYLSGEPIEARRDSNFYYLKKTLQRYRIGVAIAAAFVLLISVSAVALGVMYVNQSRLRAEAEHQTEIARAAEKQAEQRFKEVRELANFFVLYFDPLLKRLPGSAPARQALVQKGLEYLDLLARDAEGDCDLQLELAAAYMTIGDIQGEPQASNLGDYEGALVTYDKVSQMLEQSLSANPDSQNVASTHTLNLLKTGDVQNTSGRTDQALESYRAAIAEAQRWLDMRLAKPMMLEHLATGHERCGTILLKLDRLDEALAHFERCAEVQELFDIGNGDRLISSHARVVTLTHIGELLYRQGKLEQALKKYREAYETAEPFYRDFPEDIVVRRDVAITRQWMGIILSDLGRFSEALEHYKGCVAVQEISIRDMPDDYIARNDLATTLSKLGETQMALGRRDQAYDSFQRGVTLVEQLAEHYPDNSAIQRLKGVSYYKMAETSMVWGNDEQLPRAERLEHWKTAIEWLQRCLEVFEDMRERGLLSASDAGVPDEITNEINNATIVIEKLSEAE